ncbi:MAG: NAD(P)H-hydrate epimerase [Lachnospiraceae bacterium]|nr:NAD(P)H-hydrate epimerase [Lachnospiraceae bacterium]
MKYYLNGKQARETDRYTSEHIGILGIVLMERAAFELANVVAGELEGTRTDRKSHGDGIARRSCDVLGCESFDRASCRILSVVGGGNNGGDAVAAARILKTMGFDTAVYEVNREAKKSESYLIQERIAKNLGVRFLSEADFNYDCIIDGIFGVGLTREVEGVYRTAVEAINAVSGALVVGCDIPSGIDADTGIMMGCAVKCDITVTFEYIKFGMLVNEGRACSGRILCREIGLYKPQDLSEAKRLFEGISAFEYDEADLKRLLPKQKADSNKGTNGKVLVVAGSKDIYGALYLCSSACYRVGAGLVKVVTHEVNRSLLMDKLPEAMMLTYNDKDLLIDSDFFGKLADSVAWADVILVGPGLGTGPQSVALLKHVIASLKEGQRLVLDADALNILFTDEILRSNTCESIDHKIQHDHFDIDHRTLNVAKENKCDDAYNFEESKPDIWEADNVRDVIKLITHRIGKGNTVITPHIGEMVRVMKGLGEETTPGEIKRNPAEAALLVARETGAVVVLKDARTVIATPDEERLVYVNTTGNSGMSKGGSGDVLAGITAGLLARVNGPDNHETVFETACLAVNLHGRAGDRARDDVGQTCMLAGNIMDKISVP